MDLLILGISGRMSSGKSTAAKILTNEFGFEELALASKIKQLAEDGKEAILEALPWVSESMLTEFDDVLPWDGSKEGKGRLLLQKLGTEWGRDYLPNIWTSDWIYTVYSEYLPRYQEESYNTLKIVVPDVRFIDKSITLGNEMLDLVDFAKMWPIGNSNIVFWKVDRDTANITNSNHRSEVSVTSNPAYPFAKVIQNNATKEDFEESIRKLYLEMTGEV